MIHGALQPDGRRHAPPVADAAWFAKTTDRIVATMEGGRATWQYWHVYAEAQRQVRGRERAHRPGQHQVVDLLVSEVLDGRSVSIARPFDGITEPAELRRVDGTSVYTVGRRPTCSPRARSWPPSSASSRPPAAATGTPSTSPSVDLALLESTANGVTLNAGQATWCAEMATSGARLQLAIAPAGSGKTTAMRALGQRLDRRRRHRHRPRPLSRGRRRPAMGSQIDTQTDTLAKLTHSLITRRAGARRLGRRHRPLDARGDRRGRHGRHPLPGRRGAATSSSAAAASG